MPNIPIGQRRSARITSDRIYDRTDIINAGLKERSIARGLAFGQQALSTVAGIGRIMEDASSNEARVAMMDTSNSLIDQLNEVDLTDTDAANRFIEDGTMMLQASMPDGIFAKSARNKALLKAHQIKFSSGVRYAQRDQVLIRSIQASQEYENSLLYRLSEFPNQEILDTVRSEFETSINEEGGLTPQKKAKRNDEFMARSSISAVSSAINLGLYDDALNLIKDNSQYISGPSQSQFKARVLSGIRNQSNRAWTESERTEKLASRLISEYKDIAGRELVDLDRKGELTIDEVIARGELLKPSEYKAWTKIAIGDTPEESDPAALVRIQAALGTTRASEVINEEMEAGNIDPDQFISLHTTASAAVRSGPAGQSEGLSLIASRLDLGDSAGLAGVIYKMSEVDGKAELVTWINKQDAIPSRIEILEMAESIANRRSVIAKDGLHLSMGKPDYLADKQWNAITLSDLGMTERVLYDQYSSGDIEEAFYVKQLRIIGAWRIALSKEVEVKQ